MILLLLLFFAPLTDNFQPQTTVGYVKTAKWQTITVTYRLKSLTFSVNKDTVFLRHNQPIPHRAFINDHRGKVEIRYIRLDDNSFLAEQVRILP